MAFDPVYLTRRQHEVLTLLATGFTRAEVAERLGIGAETVKAHVERAMRRLGVRNIAQAAYRLGQGHCLVRDGRSTPRPVQPPRPTSARLVQRKQPSRKVTDPKAVTDPDQRAYLAALDRYLASGGRDSGARGDMLLALEHMRASQPVSSNLIPASPKEGA